MKYGGASPFDRSIPAAAAATRPAAYGASRRASSGRSSRGPASAPAAPRAAGRRPFAGRRVGRPGGRRRAAGGRPGPVVVRPVGRRSFFPIDTSPKMPAGTPMARHAASSPSMSRPPSSSSSGGGASSSSFDFLWSPAAGSSAFGSHRRGRGFGLRGRLGLRLGLTGHRRDAGGDDPQAPGLVPAGVGQQPDDRLPLAVDVVVAPAVGRADPRARVAVGRVEAAVGHLEVVQAQAVHPGPGADPQAADRVPGPGDHLLGPDDLPRPEAAGRAPDPLAGAPAEDRPDGVGDLAVEPFGQPDLQPDEDGPVGRRRPGRWRGSGCRSRPRCRRRRPPGRRRPATAAGRRPGRRTSR